MNDYSGIWKGSYEYGSGYAKNMEPVPFVLYLKDDDGVLTGTVKEAAADLCEIPTTIKGFVDLNFINFIKKYPFGFSKDPSGIMVPDRSKQHPDIIYNGELDTTQQDLVSGVWEMTVIVKKMLWRNATRSGFGKWSMRKVADLPY